jgi:hypothetical protein
MNDLEQATADPQPTWAEARAKVWHQPGHHSAAYTHDDPGDSCTAASGAHRTYATAVLCERASQLVAWRRRHGHERRTK